MQNGSTGKGSAGDAKMPNGTTHPDVDDSVGDSATENDLARRMMELTVEDDDQDFFKSSKAEHACW